ncbi:DUF3592 domain-containing protein [Streptomyces sp. NPDC006743]|uniref:DUF3592 domain-containing protein n=1 Tax=Streptomyces sp. NPDC006743 TaxID=3154480 RepID=UPI00345143A0
MTSSETAPPALYGRRRSAARLCAGELLLDARLLRRRIPLAVIGRVAVGGAGGRTLTVVRARGVAAPARLRRSCAGHGSDEPSGHHVYTYVDADGLTREWRGARSGAERAEILYDPADPEVAVFGRDTAGRLAGGFAFALGLGGALLFIAAMLLAPAVRALAG